MGRTGLYVSGRRLSQKRYSSQRWNEVETEEERGWIRGRMKGGWEREEDATRYLDSQRGLHNRNLS